MTDTILGAGGFAGTALTKELLKQGHTVRLVSRSKRSITGTEAVAADLASASDTVSAVNGSDVAYLCAGLQYNLEVWKDQWPRIMGNTIEASIRANAKLVFLDNVYMYGKVEGKMTEDTPYNPCSRKGEVRANIATMLQDEMKRGELKALIARAADVYGPYAEQTSVAWVLVFDKLLKGKKAQWMGDALQPHSFSYTLDCGRGLSLLGQSEEAFGQVWHLPTFNPAPDGKTFIEIAAKALGSSASYSVLKGWMVRMVGVFNHTVSELHEMLYQNEHPYYFDSTKFEKRFGYKPVSYEEGIRETLEFLKPHTSPSPD
jgi:nucleoside-diphosphate-sugar epimerase